MNTFKTGDKVIFRESETGPAEPGTVREVMPPDEDHPRGGEYTLDLDDGTGVLAWVAELTAAE